MGQVPAGLLTGNLGAALTAGGVPPSGPQQALAQYSAGQGTIKGMGEFGPNMPESTNLTQAAVSGPQAQQALTLGQESLVDTTAMSNFFNSQFQNFAGGLGSLLGKPGGGGGGGAGGGLSSGGMVA
jgi:hypothetical protein